MIKDIQGKIILNAETGSSRKQVGAKICLTMQNRISK